MKEIKNHCSVCGSEINSDDETYGFEGQIMCSECYDDNTLVCDCCGDRVLRSSAHSDGYIDICNDCFSDHYCRCSNCDRLVHDENTCFENNEPYCEECFERLDFSRNIHEYSYKPETIFYGEDSNRFFGVELEIDGTCDMDDKESDADVLLDLGNEDAEHIYIKHDGSLNDGMEIVTHAMTLDYHKNCFCWRELTRKAVGLGYRSHQVSTCGLHVHVNRNSLAETRDEQDIIISRILYFIEMHWNEIAKFSRRSEESLNHWAGRHGYEPSPEAIMDKAKKDCNRYKALNLCNFHTIEFRIFKGSLKYNTIIGTLEFVNQICEKAIEMTDEEMAKMSWSEFVAGINEPELIQYLKERDLYINEKIYVEEEI